MCIVLNQDVGEKKAESIVSQQTRTAYHYESFMCFPGREHSQSSVACAPYHPHPRACSHKMASGSLSSRLQFSSNRIHRVTDHQVV